METELICENESEEDSESIKLAVVKNRRIEEREKLVELGCKSRCSYRCEARRKVEKFVKSR